MRGFGFNTILIEPGLIVTDFATAALASMDGVGDVGRYGEFNAKLADLTTDVYKGPIRFLGGGPDAVSRRSSGRSPAGAHPRGCA